MISVAPLRKSHPGEGDFSRIMGQTRARVVRDDTRHPLLRRARPLAQVKLDRLDNPGRPAYGRVTVQEVEAKSALTPFTRGALQADHVDASWSLNPYAGCLHACTYCYVPDTIKSERGRWGSYVIVKKNLPTLLAREMARKAPARVYLCTGTDPYQSVEREHEVTRRCLEVLARHDWPVDILTRSPLVLRDLDVLKRFSDVRVGLSVPTLDDAARRIVEPAAPAIPARLRALRALHDDGVPTFANHAPAYPPTGNVTPAGVARAFRDAGVGWVNVSPWRYLATVLPVLRARLAGSAWEGLGDMVADETWQARYVTALEVALAREGLGCSLTFYNPPA